MFNRSQRYSDLRTSVKLLGEEGFNREQREKFLRNYCDEIENWCTGEGYIWNFDNKSLIRKNLEIFLEDNRGFSHKQSKRLIQLSEEGRFGLADPHKRIYKQIEAQKRDDAFGFVAGISLLTAPIWAPVLGTIIGTGYAINTGDFSNLAKGAGIGALFGFGLPISCIMLGYIASINDEFDEGGFPG